MKKITYIILTILCSFVAHAQQNEILTDDIASLVVTADDDFLSLPVINLGDGTPVRIDFDELSHEYHRYTYTIEHCEADWSTSDGLFTSDYLEGNYNSLVIEDNEKSLNTATLYTHYSLTIPNEDVRLKLSGNYRVTITDDNSGDEVLHAYFMVLDQKMGVKLSYVTNTDIDINNSHQQVNMTIDFPNMTMNDPDRQLHTVVMQNHRWSTARRDVRRQYNNLGQLRWEHCRDYIFDAGNEYHKFEYLDLHRNSLGVDHTDFDGTDYNVWINTDEPRPNYVYDESANGAFVIRNTDNYNNDTESEYVNVHFTYKLNQDSPVFVGDVYLNGMWTNDKLLPQYKMEYDAASDWYHCSLPLKMGYYSYQYLLLRPDGKVTILPTEGNFYQTRNTYTALVYYRPTGGRTDLLVGYAEAK